LSAEVTKKNGKELLGLSECFENSFQGRESDDYWFELIFCIWTCSERSNRRNSRIESMRDSIAWVKELNAAKRLVLRYFELGVRFLLDSLG
jgi:hypothetical protein